MQVPEKIAGSNWEPADSCLKLRSLLCFVLDACSEFPLFPFCKAADESDDTDCRDCCIESSGVLSSRRFLFVISFLNFSGLKWTGTCLGHFNHLCSNGILLFLTAASGRLDTASMSSLGAQMFLHRTKYMFRSE